MFQGSFNKKLSSDKGASLVEYALITGVLVVIFVVAGVLLYNASQSRSTSSQESVADVAPCPTDVVSSLECL